MYSTLAVWKSPICECIINTVVYSNGRVLWGWNDGNQSMALATDRLVGIFRSGWIVWRTVKVTWSSCDGLRLLGAGGCCCDCAIHLATSSFLFESHHKRWPSPCSRHLSPSCPLGRAVVLIGRSQLLSPRSKPAALAHTETLLFPLAIVLRLE